MYIILNSLGYAWLEHPSLTAGGTERLMCTQSSEGWDRVRGGLGGELERGSAMGALKSLHMYSSLTGNITAICSG